jgi:hypothetical protein
MLHANGPSAAQDADGPFTRLSLRPVNHRSRNLESPTSGTASVLTQALHRPPVGERSQRPAAAQTPTPDASQGTHDAVRPPT